MKRIEHALIENVPLAGSASVAVREFDLAAFSYPWHRHPEVELTWILEGEGLRHVGDSVEPFTAGDFCLIGAHVPHAWLTRKPSKPRRGHRARSMVVQFDPTLFGEMFWALPELANTSRLLERAAHGLCLDQDLGKRLLVLLAGRESPLTRLTALMEILHEVGRSPGSRALSLSPAKGATRSASDPILRRVLAVMNDQADQPISQSELSKLARMSPSAFSRFFRREVGKTFQAYLADLRLGLACRQLLETDRRVSEIAFAAGFGNLSNFNRLFLRSRGVGPREFRRRALGE